MSASKVFFHSQSRLQITLTWIQTKCFQFSYRFHYISDDWSAQWWSKLLMCTFWLFSGFLSKYLDTNYCITSACNYCDFKILNMRTSTFKISQIFSSWKNNRVPLWIIKIIIKQTFYYWNELLSSDTLDFLSWNNNR